MNTIKIVSWNVNGLRAVLSKDKQGKRDTGKPNVLESLFAEHDPDIVALQETKCPDTLESVVLTSSKMAFRHIVASKTRKGYSGVAVFSKMKPIRVLNDFPENDEGRVLCVEYPEFYLLNMYVPNTKPDLSRLSYRTDVWEPVVRTYINDLQTRKPVVAVGDFNVAPTELDIHTVKGHTNAHGFTKQEREAYRTTLESCDLTNAFRFLHPTKREYTWFSNFAKSRERNRGWTIDHILVSKQLANTRTIKAFHTFGDFHSSDHLPIMVELAV
jgi:exodeoxyribonuclease III